MMSWGVTYNSKGEEIAAADTTVRRVAARGKADSAFPAMLGKGIFTDDPNESQGLLLAWAFMVVMAILSCHLDCIWDELRSGNGGHACDLAPSLALKPTSSSI